MHIRILFSENGMKIMEPNQLRFIYKSNQLVVFRLFKNNIQRLNQIDFQFAGKILSSTKFFPK